MSSDISLSTTNNPYYFFDFINCTNHQEDYVTTSQLYGDNGPSMYYVAGKKAENKDDKCATTIMLEDYTKFIAGASNSSGSYMNAGDFYTKIDVCDSIFSNSFANQYKETAAIYFEQEGTKYREDMYAESILADGSIEYADGDDELAEAALNMAEAEFKLIDEADWLSDRYDPDETKKNGKPKKMPDVLSAYEARTASIDKNVDTAEAIAQYSLDDDETYFTTKEYASYILATDTNYDGKISVEESAYFEANPEEIKQRAQYIYDKNYKTFSEKVKDLF